MKTYLFPFVFAFMLLSCEEEKEKIPSGIISEDSMVNLLVDIHLLEAAVGVKNLPKDSSDFVYNQYKIDLLKKYGISDSIYTKNFDYYSSDPFKIKPIYDRIVDTLSWREERKKIQP